MRYGEATAEEEIGPKNKRQQTVLFTAAGERVPPIHKPFKRGGCQWVSGVGWVWNPTRQVIR